MTLDDILQQITQGLSGDYKNDIEYLNAQVEAYKEHPQATEIARFCGRMIYERMPEEERKEAFQVMMDENIRPIEEDLKKAQRLMQDKAFDEAKPILEALADKADEAIGHGFFQDDAMSEYYCFGEPFEEILFMTRKKPTREVRRSALPFAEIYHLYGRLLMQNKDYRAANYVLKEAVRWNPASTKMALDYAESFKALDDMEKYMETTREAFKFAFNTDDMVQCYLNVAQYFIANEQWAEAKGCALFGMQFDEASKAAQDVLAEIEEKVGGDVVSPAIEVMEALSAIHDFPLGADETLIGLSYQYGQLFLKQNNRNAARYFLNIAYGLTEAEEIKVLLNSLD